MKKEAVASFVFCYSPLVSCKSKFRFTRVGKNSKRRVRRRDKFNDFEIRKADKKPKEASKCDKLRLTEGKDRQAKQSKTK